MICKEDVISWFKELESYKRLDTMCTLLRMCLPFELRFLGTCLEELGRRDSQELRGIELRVNNSQELTADIATCQTAEPNDKKVRRKMAMYLALIRGACNRPCVIELFKTLDGWGDLDFTKFDPDILEELLLVYTMAANHPVFTFEQRMKCAEIYIKISESKLFFEQERRMCEQQQQQQQPPTVSAHTMQFSNVQQMQQQQQQQQIPVMPQTNITMGYPQTHLAQMIPTDGSIQHQITVDGIHMIPSNMGIPAEFAMHPNATWTLRPNLQTYPLPSLEHPPQASSPMLSQPSSPSNSRTASPSRSSGNSMMQQQQQSLQQQVRNMPTAGLRNVRRPSAETTPPPNVQSQQQIINLIGNPEMIPLHNMKNLDDIVVNNDGSISQLRALIRNGYRAGHHTIPRQSKSTMQMQHHNQQVSQQQQQHQHQQQHYVGNMPIQNATNAGNYVVNASLAYTQMQNMSLVDVHNPMENNAMSSCRHKSGGSDSGSSIGSSGDISPPETPTIMGNNSVPNSIRLNEHQQQNYNKQMNLARINGRPDKLLPVSGVGGGGIGHNSGTTTVIYAPSAISPQQQHYISNELILTGGPTLMQTSSTNNNNSQGGVSGTTSMVGSATSNNNLCTNTVLITSPSTLSSGVLSNVISSNQVMLQQQPQQFSATYPYHAQQHLATTTRPPIIPHNPGIVPTPTGFRHPGFQMQHNGEILYPYPPGIAFLSSAAPPPPNAVAVRSSPSTSVPPPPANTSVPPPQLPQQQQQQQSQTNPPNATHLAGSPYTAITVGIGKQMSCYNCGSQSHTGRDCQEVSMEDATRGAVYKLDYTVSPTTGNSSSSSSSNSNNNMGASSNSTNMGGQQIITTVDIGTETSSPTASISSTSSLSNSNPK